MPSHHSMMKAECECGIQNFLNKIITACMKLSFYPTIDQAGKPCIITIPKVCCLSPRMSEQSV